jgi:hypothetical protein
MSDLDYLTHLATITNHLEVLQQLRPSPTLQMALERLHEVLKAITLTDSHQ